VAELYVYGVVPAAGPPLELPDGVAGAAPFLHADGSRAAIVSELEPGTRTGRAADARAHERVLRAALDGRDAVLPVRFGSVYADAAALEAQLLGPARTQLDALLGELAGTVELQLRALYPDEERLLRELVHAEPALLRLRRRAQASGDYHAQIQLGEAMLAAFQRRRAQDQARLRGRLAPLARDWRERTELPERVAAQLAFLVERRRVPELERAAAQLAAEAADRLRLTLVGPLPPYSFVAFELEPAGVA
jgi:hypothetical protein